MRRGGGVIRAESESQEDLVLQAGWMYADLFLALTVIFLATISFVPQFAQSGDSNGPLKPNTGINTATTFNYSKGYTLLVPLNQYDQVATKVAQFLAQEGLSATSEIIFAQIVGGYDPQIEKPSAGQLRAITFAVELNKNFPKLLVNAQRFIEASPTIAPEKIALRLTFAQTLPTE